MHKQVHSLVPGKPVTSLFSTTEARKRDSSPLFRSLAKTGGDGVWSYQLRRGEERAIEKGKNADLKDQRYREECGEFGEEDADGRYITQEGEVNVARTSLSRTDEGYGGWGAEGAPAIL